MTPESWLVFRIAEQTAEKIARRAVRDLQRMESLLSGEDSGLQNTWDEICVQVQGERSIHWAAYDDTVFRVVLGLLKNVSETHCQAIWLQTPEGETWREETEEDDAFGKSRSAIPWVREDVAEFVVQKVYALADKWSNPRIRGYLNQ